MRKIYKLNQNTSFPCSNGIQCLHDWYADVKNNLSAVTAIILCSMGFGIDCVFHFYAFTKVYAQKHIFWYALRLDSRSFCFQCNKLRKSVNIGDSYRSNTIVSTEYSRPQNSISL